LLSLPLKCQIQGVEKGRAGYGKHGPFRKEALIRTTIPVHVRTRDEKRRIRAALGGFNARYTSFRRATRRNEQCE